ncbi:MAG: hypothetical protein AAFX76_04420 [Planctomycetota bacterium]
MNDQTPRVLMSDASGPLTPILCLAGAADGEGDRLVALAAGCLDFPALLIEVDPGAGSAGMEKALDEAVAASDRKVSAGCCVYGVGAGADAALRFVGEHAGRVSACAVYDATAWSVPGEAGGVAWLVGCGEGDDPEKLWAAEAFQVALAESGCGVDFLDWTGGVAGGPPEHAVENALRFFGERAAA